ncbi:MAG: transcription termination/antitermination protein NusA [Alphaproteobacteria bacterium]|nr:transcription termination/antitermination protein NusA [Alphaproteobacteria bacterium]MBO7537042.1 transcription termination/antitermination protein NusA [Alphaproteobacteria bacterium]MBO7641911.1 transcription termination/antitermination protein NusA [Alphaproteobacteria bacterium]
MSTALWTDSKFYGPELLQVADSVAREKGLNKDQVLEAMEGAIQKAAKSRYGYESDIRASIDKKTGEVTIMKYLTVKDPVEDEFNEITLEEAKKMDPNAEIGTVFTTKLPPINFGRVAAQTGRQIIVQKIREAEREKQYNEFKDRVGEIVSGVVKRAEFNSVTLDVGHTEAVIRRDQLLPKENFRVGDRVRAYIADVSREDRGPQIFLSRTHPQFLVKLFWQEVPEIYERVIEIKSVARDPGSRAKIAVYTSDANIDPIGACVGVRGSRVQAIIQELQGEKIDIVLWSDDPATFAVNALAPAEVSRVVVDEENHKFEVLAPDSQLSLAIGRRGQNVRLASMLIGWNVTVVSETEALERKNKEYHESSKAFMDALDCDEVIAHLLVTEGFSSVEELAYISKEDLSSIEGFDENLAEELISRANVYLGKKEEEIKKQLSEKSIDKKIIELGAFSNSDLLVLANAGILKLDDVADLSADELVELLPNLSEPEASDIIMKAREHWFK